MSEKNLTGENVVRIKSIEDLNLKKIKPSDLNKIYVDENGQEYKLRYDPATKKVKIIKVIKGVLNGSFVKTQYDKLSEDQKAKIYVKYKIAEISKEKLLEEEQPNKTQVPTKFTQPQKIEQKIQFEETEKINNLEDVFKVMEKTADRLKIAEKNIYDSGILSERYSFDDKIVLDEISRAINSIISEFQNGKERYEDVLKGYEDSRLKTKLYKEEIKKIIETKPPETVMNFLRELEIQNIFVNTFNIITKFYNDIEYKLNSIPEERVISRKFHERQKFDDALFLINICKKNAENILKFFQTSYENLLKG
jgi:hypothetical protein